ISLLSGFFDHWLDWNGNWYDGSENAVGLFWVETKVIDVTSLQLLTAIIVSFADALTQFLPSRYGEIVDVNLVRDKGTRKSKGFSFVAYEDQRSTVLAVDNLNGAQVLGRTIRVDHVAKYKKKEEEDEEEEQRKREERGVCRAFQRGDCTRGAGCKFSHNEQRAAKTGWGAQDAKNEKQNDGIGGPTRGPAPSNRVPDTKMHDKDSRSSKIEKDGDRKRTEMHSSDKRSKLDKGDDDSRGYGGKPPRDYKESDRRSSHEESYGRENQESDRRSSRSGESASRDYRRKDEVQRVRSHRE
ncbi:zinc finger CCCH domain-containing protein 25-like protein, partial [Tanacetum coccineum]